MVRDVSIASMNKGQFPLAIVGVIFIISISKLSEENTAKLILKLVDSFVNLHLLGWFLFIMSLFGWFLTAKLLRKSHSDEIKRIAEHKTELQQKVLNKKLKSSK